MAKDSTKDSDKVLLASNLDCDFLAAFLKSLPDEGMAAITLLADRENTRRRKATTKKPTRRVGRNGLSSPSLN